MICFQEVIQQGYADRTSYGRCVLLCLYKDHLFFGGYIVIGFWLYFPFVKLQKSWYLECWCCGHWNVRSLLFVKGMGSFRTKRTEVKIYRATGKPPWSDLAPVTALFKIGSNPEPPPFPDNLSPLAIDFLKLCFERFVLFTNSFSMLEV